MKRFVSFIGRSMLVSALGLLAGCATSPELVRLDANVPGSLLNEGSLLFMGPDANLFVIQPELSTPLRLTADADPRDGTRLYTGYAWVGDRVAYVVQERASDAESGSTSSQSAMYVSVPGERARRVFRGEEPAPFFLYPTPDGERVGYLGGRSAGAGFVMGSVDLTSGDRIVHGTGQPYYSAWSPDGLRVVSHSGGAAGRASLRIQDLGDLRSGADAGGGQRAGATLPLRTGPFQTPAYSPDGSRIAVVLSTPDGPGIHFLDADGSDLGRLVSTRGAVAMSLAPDGNSLAFIDGVVASIGSVVGPLSVNGRTTRVISPAATAFFWSPDSLKLIYFEPFAARSGAYSTLAYRVGLYNALDGQTSIVATMQPAPGFAEQIVPFFDQYNRAYTIWSPDSRLVALNSLSASGFEVIHLLDTETANPGEAVRVSFVPAASTTPDALGLIPADGITSRPLTYGRNPFFSPR